MSSVLYDAPGPRTRRRILVWSIVSALVLAGLAGLGLWQFASHGQLDAAKWTPFTQWPIWEYLFVGLLGGVALGTALGLHLPHGVHWRDLVPLGFISAAGFTMALFFATATIGPGQMLSELKMGAVVSIAACVVAIAAARALRAGRFRD